MKAGRLCPNGSGRWRARLRAGLEGSAASRTSHVRQRLEVGVYELTFHAGDYFRGAGIATSDPPFLDEVVVRVGIADAGGNYHVPLLLAPYGYSTYRGS